MKSRLVASAALSALVLLGTTGCTFLTPQATSIDPYNVSDGVNVPDSEGPLDIRNAMVIATEDGSTGNLIAAIVNTTDKAEVLTVEIEGLEPLTVRVGAGDTVSLGATTDPLRIDDLDTMPGATIPMYFQSGDATGSVTEVPVLDGTLPEYADLVPEAD
ncbi:DNA modification methylase [Microbacterium sp. A196]|uniref:DNA modification methylase n=1 Tax=unclassified Microbacterium TaxID=2609290 RepID=UPI003FD1CF0B